VGPRLAYLGGQTVQLDEAELHGAVRRAELLLAAGGDPRRKLELDGRAVTVLAADLESPERVSALLRELERLHGETEGLPAVEAALTRLRQEPELAWRCYACAVLADALAGD
jgi:NAD(P)-dependent dehydrogenase (short-subunit alcohol dehydrogenase family)